MSSSTDSQWIGCARIWASVLDASDEVGASLPVTALVDQFYKDVQKLRWRALGYVEFDQALARDGLGRMGRCPVYIDEHAEVF